MPKPLVPRGSGGPQQGGARGAGAAAGAPSLQPLDPNVLPTGLSRSSLFEALKKEYPNSGFRLIKGTHERSYSRGKEIPGGGIPMDVDLLSIQFDTKGTSLTVTKPNGTSTTFGITIAKDRSCTITARPPLTENPIYEPGPDYVPLSMQGPPSTIHYSQSGGHATKTGIYVDADGNPEGDYAIPRNKSGDEANYETIPVDGLYDNTQGILGSSGMGENPYGLDQHSDSGHGSSGNSSPIYADGPLPNLNLGDEVAQPADGKGGYAQPQDAVSQDALEDGSGVITYVDNTGVGNDQSGGVEGPYDNKDFNAEGVADSLYANRDILRKADRSQDK